MKETPEEILTIAIGKAFAYDRGYQRFNIPGNIIKSLSDEERKILKKLKSDDIKYIRDDLIP